MKAELLAADTGRWDSFLREVRHDFYHLPSYVALSARQERGEPRALYVADGGRAMLLPLIVRPIPGGGSDATSPYGYPGPLLSGTDDPAFLRSALIAGMHLLRAQRIVSVFVRLHPLLNRAPPEGVGDVVQAGDTINIDLTLPAEELWHQTRATHRNEINRAVKAGRRARFDETWTQYEAFKRLYRGTMARVSAMPYYFFDDAYFEGLRAALGDRLRLCAVEIDGTLAAAGLFVETSGIVQYHLSASDPAFAREGLTRLIVHFVRSWAKDRGDRDFHLGGGVGASEDPLLQFKMGFSPLRHPFRTLRIVVDQDEYTRLVQARDPSGTGALDDFFPLYRAPRSQAQSGAAAGAAALEVGRGLERHPEG